MIPPGHGMMRYPTSSGAYYPGSGHPSMSSMDPRFDPRMMRGGGPGFDPRMAAGGGARGYDPQMYQKHYPGNCYEIQYLIFDTISH